jgi:excisionase family DNA binding protein
VQANPLPEILLTEQEVAAMFGVSTHAVKKWREKGLISFFRIGKTIRFDQEEVQEASSGCCDHAASA